MTGEPEVRVHSGVLRGRTVDGLSIFKGVPFAAPPVGAARFQAPQPVQSWDGVRDAAEFGPPAPQDTGGMGGGDGSQVRFAEGDDWLTLNVWTPTPDPAAHRPVLVWIYGGAYKLGFSGSPGYDARRLAAEGDAVVVTLNYRLGIEGFVQLDGAPANRGLLDQVAALRWVRENIAGFGGDPDQVTVFGESAGAGSIGALLAMPSAAGLFRRAITQSLPGIFQSRDLADDIGRAIAAETGRRATVADLSEVDPRRLTGAGASLGPKMREHEDRWGIMAHTLSPFSPVVDGDVLPVAPWRAVADGAARDIELIIGHNRDEYRLFIAFSGQLGKITEEQATIALRLYGPGDDAQAAYQAALPDATLPQLHEVVISDWLFRMPALHLADAQAAAGGRVHVYELTWPTPGMGGVMGTPHGLDGPLVFGTLDQHLGPMLIGPEPSEDAWTVSNAMRSAWTGFATNGDPGWPAYDTTDRLVRLFDAPPTVAPYPEQASLHIWQNHVFDALPLL